MGSVSAPSPVCGLTPLGTQLTCLSEVDSGVWWELIEETLSAQGNPHSPVAPAVSVLPTPSPGNQNIPLRRQKSPRPLL